MRYLALRRHPGSSARRALGAGRWWGGLAALVALVTLAAAACSSPAASPARSAPSAGGRPGVVGDALFGGDTQLLSEQAQLGRKLAIVRDYYRLGLGATFPKPVDRQAMAQGSTLLVSLDTIPGGSSYASIAAGQEDAAISSFLHAVEQAAVRYHLGAIYICFEHEADTGSHHAGLGTPAQFVQAWDHVHQLAASAHLDWNQGGRLHWVLILTRVAYAQGLASSFWPGANEVDVVAADGYNTANCRQAPAGASIVAGQGARVLTPADIFDPVLSFASSHGNPPVFIAEWASIPYASSSVQPNFIHEMQQYVTSHPQIKAALYWSGHGHGNGCNYVLASQPASLAALRAMAHVPGLQGRVG
jgi:hypothetical protein